MAHTKTTLKAAFFGVFFLLLLVSVSYSAEGSKNLQLTIPLEFQEIASNQLSSAFVSIQPCQKFNNEPNLDKDVIRGQIPFADGTSTPFILDRNHNLLYVSTNDVADFNNVLQYKMSHSRNSMGDFEKVRINTTIHSKVHPILLTFSSIQKNYAYLVIQSFWNGKMELDGRAYQIALIENPDNSNPSLLIRPWEDHLQPFKTKTCVDLAKNLFFEGHYFKVETTFDPHVPNYKLELSEQEVEMVPVTLGGKYIQQVVLEKTGNKSVTMLLPGSQTNVLLPVGTYSCRIWLKEKNSEAFGYLPQGVTNSSQATNFLNVGGPLNNTVHVVNGHTILRMNYTLAGQGDSVYKMENTENLGHPQFIATQNGEKVDSGTFEYG